MDFPVIAIEGIGNVFSRKLFEKGITTVIDFLEYGMSRHNNRKPLKGREKNWFYQAKLFLIKGIDKDHAEVLIRNGATLDKLDLLKAETIQNYLKNAVDKKSIKEIPEIEAIQKWQLDSVRISFSPIIIFCLGNKFGNVTASDFKLRIKGKNHEFDQKGKVVLSGIQNWNLRGELLYKDRVIDFLDFTTKEQFAVFRKSYNGERFKTTPVFVLATPHIQMMKGMRVQFAEREIDYFEDGSNFWGKNNENRKGFMLYDHYTINGRSFILNVVRNSRVEIEHNKKYTLRNGNFVMGGNRDV